MGKQHKEMDVEFITSKEANDRLTEILAKSIAKQICESEHFQQYVSDIRSGKIK